MQSELTEVNPNTPPTTQTGRTRTTTAQHGFISNEQESALPLSREEADGATWPLPGDSRLSTEHSSLNSTGDIAAQRVSLEGSSPSPRSSANRILDYEQASSPPQSKASGGPASKVITRVKAPAGFSSPIAVVPNGEFNGSLIPVYFRSFTNYLFRGSDSRSFAPGATRLVSGIAGVS